MRRLQIHIAPRALWVGVVIGDREPDAVGWYRSISVALLPCVVVTFDVRVGRDA